MRLLNAIDNGFLTVETRQMPMHVGGLLLFKPPDEMHPEYMRELYQRCVSVEAFRPPFDQKLHYPPGRLGMPYWDADPELDIEYHVRHSALPRPGRYRELFALISRLHGTLLDRTRPLWEYSLIEGLETGEFAVYAKMHHALIDGVAAMKLLQSSLTKDPDARNIPVPWSAAVDPGGRRARGVRPGFLDIAKAQLESFPAVARALGRTAALRQLPADDRMAIPFEAPRSPLNTRITGARRFVAQSYGLDRVHRVRKALGATVNDVVLAMCASSLRRYLLDIAGGLPERPLIAMTPVSVRPEDSDDFGNAMSALLVNLGTHLADPAKRLETIRASMSQGKELLGGLSHDEVTLFTMLMLAPAIAPSFAGLGHRIPSFNLVISNVPGPTEPIYWDGARMVGMYPASIVIHGMAVNITVTSNVGSLDFGITACRRSAPRVQRLIDFLEDGLAELEDVAGIR